MVPHSIFYSTIVQCFTRKNEIFSRGDAQGLIQKAVQCCKGAKIYFVGILFSYTQNIAQETLEHWFCESYLNLEQEIFIYA
jgi:hypothetical protein